MRGTAQVAVESEILLRDDLRREDDLRGVLGKMLDHVIDGVDARYRVILNGITARELIGGQTGHHLRRPFDSLSKTFRQDFGTDPAAGGKFRIAVTLDWNAAKRADNPLLNIACQMKDEIADGVLVLMAARPDLLFAQLSKAHFDSFFELPQFVDGEFQKQRFDGHSLFDAVDDAIFDEASANGLRTNAPSLCIGTLSPRPP